MVTGKAYAEKAMYVYNLKPKAGYIWGQAGSTWTAARQEALEKKYNSDPKKYSDYKIGAQIGKKWIGHRVWDCSGLTSWDGGQFGLKFHHGSNSSWKYDCEYKGKMTSGLKLPVGAWVYTGNDSTKPHIGIVVDDTWVVEAQGTSSGVVRSKITNTKWKYWGLGKGIKFDFIPKAAKEKTKVETKSYPTLRRGAKGNDVKTLQELLKKAGSTLVVDGIFGAGTQSAVRSFQSKHNLVVDGIVGPKTWAELQKIK